MNSQKARTSEFRTDLSHRAGAMSVRHVISRNGCPRLVGGECGAGDMSTDHLNDFIRAASLVRRTRVQLDFAFAVVCETTLARRLTNGRSDPML